MSVPVPSAIASAGKWYALLSSEQARPTDYAGWQAWRDASPENEQAWEQVEVLVSRFASLPAHVRSDTLQPSTSRSRRLVLKQLALLIGAGAAGTVVYQQRPWQELLADHATETGEMRQTALADGSQLFLNTGSAVNLSFSASAHVVELLKGEVYIETAAHKLVGAPRLQVVTKHGSFLALGTRFNVRDYGDYSMVSVYEGAVRATPVDGLDQRLVHPGQSVRISRQAADVIVEEVVSSAWIKGLLIVFSMPLDQFLAELGRYRRGVIRCDPSLATLKVTGNFYTRDTDAVLASLPGILPVRIDSLTRYWITVKSA